MTDPQLERLIHNYFTEKANGQYIYQDIVTIKTFINHLVNRETGQLKECDLPKYKVGLMFICLNPQYWEFAKEAIVGARQYFLPGHEVEMMLWTDMPSSNDEEAFSRATETLKKIELARTGKSSVTEGEYLTITQVVEDTLKRAKEGVSTAETITKFETEPIEWPYPTLMRYNLFLGQEEYLKKFDYIFYCDLDMKFVNIVGDEVLGDLTAAQHPMYALRREYQPPYEPNPESSAYIPRSGLIIVEGDKKPDPDTSKEISARELERMMRVTTSDRPPLK